MKIREIYNKLSANYWLTSLTISVTAFLIYLFFITKVKIFPFYFSSLVVSAAVSASIGYQYALIKNLFPNIRPTFGKLSHLFQNGQYQIFSNGLGKKLHKSWLYNLTIITVVTPFLILELIHIGKWKWFNGPMPLSFFYLHEPTLWSLLLDIINHVFGYLMLFLLAVIIWMMIELTIIVSELEEKYSVNIDLFNVDKTGGLKPLRILVLSIVSNYFIIITMAIISYMSPTATIFFYISPELLITPEIILFIPMLFVGVILFITAQKTIRNLIDKGVNLELEKINRRYKEIYSRVCEISSNKINDDNKKELEELRVVLDILEKEEIKINAIKYKRFDIKTIITFITTILLPITTLIRQIIELKSN